MQDEREVGEDNRSHMHTNTCKELDQELQLPKGRILEVKVNGSYYHELQGKEHYCILQPLQHHYHNSLNLS